MACLERVMYSLTILGRGANLHLIDSFNINVGLLNYSQLIILFDFSGSPK